MKSDSPARGRPGRRPARPRRGDVPIERDTFIANQIRWPVRFARELGRISDGELAVRMGVSLTAVVHERRRRGIGPSREARPPIDWTAEMDALLGVASDRAVARELGVHPASVMYRREKLGIPASLDRAPKRRKEFWTPFRLSLLGTARDGDVARRLKISRARVAAARRRHGVPPFVPRAAKVVWTREMVSALGRLSDKNVARRFGIGEDTVRRERHRRGIRGLKEDSWAVLAKPELRAVLKRQTGEVVARTGLNIKTIQRLREKLGVPKPGNKTAWSRKTLAWLGKLPDEEIARRLGLKLGTVRLKRNQAGIRFRQTRQWTERELEIVRRHDVDEAARRTRRTRKAVLHLRDRLGLERYGLPTRWTREIVMLLGRVPDEEIARRTGYAAGTVRLKRLALGVRSIEPRVWTAHEIEVAVSHPIAEAAEQLDRPPREVAALRRTLGLDGALGRPR